MNGASDYVGTIEAARLARVAPGTVTRWFDEGKIGGYHVPNSKHRRISVASLREFLVQKGVPTDLIDALEAGNGK
jgi:Helix-turn-helix domain